MRFVEFNVRDPKSLERVKLNIRPEVVDSFNKTPVGTLLQVGTVAYMVTESVDEVRKILTGGDLQ